MRKRLKLVPVLFLCVMALGACNNQAYVVHPGAVNTFDSQTYDVLVTAHAAIEATKTQIASGAFSGTVLRDVSIGLNTLVDAYNLAETTYLAYHAAASATPPTATVAQANQLQGQTAGIPQLVANLNAAKAGK